MINLYKDLTRVWGQDPSRPVIYFQGESWTFEQIDFAVRRLVILIQQKTPHAKGVIAVAAKNNWHRLLAILACLHEARTFLTEPHEDGFSALSLDWTLTDDIISNALLSTHAVSTLSSKAYASEKSMLRLAATSGTTGSPKWVLMSVGSQWGRIQESRDRIGEQRAEANMFSCGPSAWFARFFGAAANGFQISLDTDAQYTLEFLLKQQSPNLYASPDQLVYFVKVLDLLKSAKPALHAITIAGGLITAAAAKALSETGATLFSQYASTECGHTTQNAFEAMDQSEYVLGIPAPQVQIQIRSSQGTVLPSESSGQIWLKTPYMADGYIDTSTGQLSTFPGGWFYSGDQGQIDSKGRLVYLGRDADLVNIRGVKFNLKHVDDFFIANSHIEDAAAFLMTGEMDFPEVWVAVVTRYKLDAKKLEQSALASLGNLLAPTRIVLVRFIPRTPTGKIRRQEMSAQMSKSIHGS